MNLLLAVALLLLGILAVFALLVAAIGALVMLYARYYLADLAILRIGTFKPPGPAAAEP